MALRYVFVRRVAICALVLQTFGIAVSAGLPATAAAQDSALAGAVSAYREGEFATCVQLVDAALASGRVVPAERALAYEYLARACARLGNEARAIESFGRLLDLNPSWRPDRDRMPPSEIALFERALAVRPAPVPVAPPPAKDPSATSPQAAPPRAVPQAPSPAPATIGDPRAAGAVEAQPRRKSRTMLWVAGGLCAASVAALALSGGGGGGGGEGTAVPLPGAPSLPSRP